MDESCLYKAIGSLSRRDIDDLEASQHIDTMQLQRGHSLLGGSTAWQAQQQRTSRGAIRWCRVVRPTYMSVHTQIGSWEGRKHQAILPEEVKLGELQPLSGQDVKMPGPARVAGHEAGGVSGPRQ